MSALTQSWLQRENEFAAFTTGPLLDFWQQRQEDVFMGVDDV
ncbi:MAG: lysophospholipase, partial [Hafnia sp.]